MQLNPGRQPTLHTIGLPFQIDSAYVADTAAGKNLTYKDVRRQRGKIAEVGEYRALEGLINDFCRIDSIRRAGKFQQWLDSLEPGMTQDASATEIGTIRMGDSTPVDLWRLTFASYPACPVFSGAYVIARIEHGGQVTHVPVGKTVVSADPPSFFREMITATVSHDWISITTVSTSDDDTETPGEEVKKHCYTVRITGSGAETSQQGGVIPGK